MKFIKIPYLTICLALVLNMYCFTVYGDESLRVIGIDGSAWVSAEPSGVKRSLTVGDSLRDQDRIDVSDGSALKLQHGWSSSNFVYIQGPSIIRVKGLTGQYDIEMGKMTALLEVLPSGQKFTVETPAAVASVRGTQFWVDYQKNIMETAVYEGTVQVALRSPDNQSLQSQMVNEGEKLIIHASLELTTDMLSTLEANEFKRILSLFKQPTRVSSTPHSGISDSIQADEVYEDSEEDILVSSELTW